MDHFKESTERLNRAKDIEPHRGNEEYATRQLLFAIAHGQIAIIERLEALLADDIAVVASKRS